MYLDSLFPLEVKVGYGALGLHGSLGYEDKQVLVQGKPYQYALSTHPPARLRFHLGGCFQGFRCQVAINDDVHPGVSQADFAVFADGHTVAHASCVVAGEPPRTLTADIRGVQRLELVVETSHWDFCHAVWLDPEVGGYGVLLAAGDTFRAAAIEQLRIWGTRIGAPVISGKEGGDPAGIVFDGVKQATGTGEDVLIVDTAGRLQNKTHLMDELSKIRRVLGRLNPDAPHDILLVLDATTGQNALAQVEVFKETAGVTGLLMTKLDGTARGGVMVAAAERFGLPIHAIGVGEGVNDLRPFDARAVARAIAGLPPE